MSERPAGAVLAVRVSPKSGVNKVYRAEEGVVPVKVSAAAVDGAANAALARLLADVVGVPKSTVEVVAGQTARRKRVLFRGLTATDLIQRLSSSQEGA